MQTEEINRTSSECENTSKEEHVFINIEICPQQIEKVCNLESIERIPKNRLTYNTFFWEYMKSNKPVIISNSSNDWECTNWTTLNGNVNFEYLQNKIPDCKVPVSDCAVQYYNSHIKTEISFHTFLDYWKNKRYEGEKNGYDTDDDSDGPELYLKDWHLKKDMPEYNFYTVPQYFGSDWLNEYCIDKNKDDYMFVYMGPKGTWTPFHADVFSSFSWSTNILGRKKWILMPPGEENKLREKLDQLPFSINIELLIEKNVIYFEIIQNAAEAIFVPSGWYHQVWNLDDTISINHNWFNSCNIETIWSTLEQNLVSVKKEIDNCHDMENFNQHCQIILKSCFGINYRDFYRLVKFILDKRLNAIENSKDIILFDKFKLGPSHLIYEIKILKETVKNIFENCDMCQLMVYDENYLNETNDEVISEN